MNQRKTWLRLFGAGGASRDCNSSFNLSASLYQNVLGHDLVHSEYNMFRPQLRQVLLHCERAKFGLSTPARQFSSTRTVAAEDRAQPSGRYIQGKPALGKIIAVARLRLNYAGHLEFEF